MNDIYSYKDLVVYQRSRELTRLVYAVIRQLPPSESKNLYDQLSRAVISVSSNIAEGNARIGAQDYIHYLGMARASNAEVQAQLQACLDIGYCREEDIEAAMAMSARVAQMLNKLINSLRRKMIIDKANKNYENWDK